MAVLTDVELVERLGHVVVDRDNADFYRGWLDEELRLNRCADCGRWHHPPRPMCPSCWSWDVVPTPVSGRGTVHLLIRLHQGPPAPGVDYAAAPYPVVTVELEEQVGLRFTSTVIDCPPDDIAIGMPVELTWIDRHGSPFPVFRRSSSTTSASSSPSTASSTTVATNSVSGLAPAPEAERGGVA